MKNCVEPQEDCKKFSLISGAGEAGREIKTFHWIHHVPLIPDGHVINWWHREPSSEQIAPLPATLEEKPNRI